jgi:aldose 1-epimerase
MHATGEQYVIASGAARATVTGVGAGLRTFTVDGADLVEPFDADEHPPLGAGGVLVPWPNRTAGARWRHHDTEQHLEVTEAGRGHAIHGLLRRATWTVVSHTDDAVTLAADVEPGTPGWPQPLHVETTYAVGDEGLTVTHALTDTGDGDVPVGVGTHPYLRAGTTPPARCTVGAATVRIVEVDDLLVPTATRPVRPDEDLRGGRLVADLALDTCFGADPDRDRVLATLRAPDGTGVALWADAAFGWVQLFTPGDPGGADGPFGRGRAIAVEPMTCPPDALNSGTDLHVLAAGETWTVRWGLAPLGEPR